MATDTCEFKKVFPEFADDNQYSPAQIEYWGEHSRASSKC